MRLNKKVQYALLLALYLTRAGKSSAKEISANLKISSTFLDRIALTLNKKGILKTTRGRNGGHELAYEVTVGDVINALDPVAVIARKDVEKYVVGDSEHRALAFFSNNLKTTLNQYLNKKVKDVERECTASEMKVLNKLNSESWMN